MIKLIIGITSLVGICTIIKKTIEIKNFLKFTFDYKKFKVWLKWYLFTDKDLPTCKVIKDNLGTEELISYENYLIKTFKTITTKRTINDCLMEMRKCDYNSTILVSRKLRKIVMFEFLVLKKVR